MKVLIMPPEESSQLDGLEGRFGVLTTVALLASVVLVLALFSFVGVVMMVGDFTIADGPDWMRYPLGAVFLFGVVFMMREIFSNMTSFRIEGDDLIFRCGWGRERRCSIDEIVKLTYRAGGYRAETIGGMRFEIPLMGMSNGKALVAGLLQSIENRTVND